MSRVKSFTASWLNGPAPGAKLFSLPGEDARSSNYKNWMSGRRQVIARRGPEIFVAAGKQIRWGDLAYLKERWDAKQSFKGSRTDASAAQFDMDDEAGIRAGEGYRIIKTPVADDIRQLVMSPQQDFLAVLTCHTVHICILPDASHLTAKDTTPFKPKFWTLGPVTHVTSRPAIASALWHPLGLDGSCLVTVTEDAVVRVWELSTADRWSFDTPSVSIDLKRLADGTSLDQDFSPSTSATSRGFSPDSFDMEVAAAAFPSRSSGGWSPMTLWVAMTSGDVYALCPLLPQRFAPPPMLIPSLSVSVVAQVAAIEDDPDTPAGTKRLAQQQMEWMADIDKQTPMLIDGAPGELPVEIYSRPLKPGTVPMLQGPFEFDRDLDEDVVYVDDDVELKDIFVIGETLSTTELMMGEDQEIELDENERDGLSLTIVCLMTTSGFVKICLDIDRVAAQWLPPRNKSAGKTKASAPSSQPSLLLFQAFDVMKPAEQKTVLDGWPMFSEDITSRYSFFVTHGAGITRVSLASWVFRLEGELQADTDAGADFRLDLLVQGEGSERERIYQHSSTVGPLTAAMAIRDPDLGYLVLSATPQDPVTIFFDSPEDGYSTLDMTPKHHTANQMEARRPLDIICEPRPFFQTPTCFDTNSRAGLKLWHNHLKQGRHMALMGQETRLSKATMEIFSEAHRIVASESYELSHAVASLFRKCEALQAELHDQVAKANEVRLRIEAITGEDSNDKQPETDEQRFERRLTEVAERQAALNERADRVKRQIGRTTTRELSDKEAAWMLEVGTLAASIDALDGVAVSPAAVSHAKASTKDPWQRLNDLRKTKSELLTEAAKLRPDQYKTGDGANGEPDSPSPASTPAGLKVPSNLRRVKILQVMKLLERETALVDAVKGRLERLSVT